jgi:hypothetical protein
MALREVVTMKAVKFHTVIGEDRVIRIPPDFVVPAGDAEVIVLQLETDGAEATTGTREPSGEEVVSEEHLFDRLIKDAEELGIDDLPEDFSENHDHYIHGTPKRGQQP